MSDREVLSLEPIADDPEVGRWLAAMEDCRRDTLTELLGGLGDEVLDQKPPGAENSIGSVLYHVALVEADWLLADIFGHESATAAEPALLPFTDRDTEGHLTHVAGETLGQHLERLAAVRAILLHRLRPMPSSDFHALREREAFDVTPAWVVAGGAGCLLAGPAASRPHLPSGARSGGSARPRTPWGARG